LATVWNILAYRLLRILLEVILQAGEPPTVIESVILHLPVRFLLRFPVVIHFVESDDEHSAIASEVAVHVDGMIALVAQQTENRVYVFLGWLLWRSADRAGQLRHAICFVF